MPRLIKPVFADEEEYDDEEALKKYNELINGEVFIFANRTIKYKWYESI